MFARWCKVVPLAVPLSSFPARARRRTQLPALIPRNFAGGLLAAPLATEAQQVGKLYRIGVLSTTGPEQENFIWSDLRGLLRERGWVEGQNLVIEWRYAEGKYERLQDLATDWFSLSRT